MIQAVLLALIAGYADTVGFLRFEAFAGLMTGNTILLGIELATHKYGAAARQVRDLRPGLDRLRGRRRRRCTRRAGLSQPLLPPAALLPFIMLNFSDVERWTGRSRKN